MKDRFMKYVEPTTETGCWIWMGGTFKSGYGMFSPKEKSTKQAHRFSYEMFIGEIPNGMMVCHKCDTPLCVNPDHLFVGTAKDNVRDMIRKGRNYKVGGEQHGMSKLKREDVIAIVEEYQNTDITMAKLAKRYGVCAPQIHRIVHGKRWKNVFSI